MHQLVRPKLSEGSLLRPVVTVPLRCLLSFPDSKYPRQVVSYNRKSCRGWVSASWQSRFSFGGWKARAGFYDANQGCNCYTFIIAPGEPIDMEVVF